MGNLNENISYYDTLLHFPDLTFYSEDVEGIVNSWSKGAEKFFGLHSDNIIGKDISILYTVEVLSRFSDAKQKLAESDSNAGLPVNFLVKYK